MKVTVSLEFNSLEEASAYLAGGKPSAPAKEAVPAPAKEKAAPAAAKAKAPAKAVDVKKVLEEVTQVYQALLSGPNANESKAYLIGLVGEFGGNVKASTIAPEKLPAFLEKVKEYQASLLAESASETTQEESLV